MGLRAINARPHEIWETDDGAPAGVPFDLLIPSISQRGRDYRIARLAVERCIVHQPACRAWRAGNRRCRHIARALAVAEDPLRTLALDIVEAWEAGGHQRGPNREEFGAALYRSAQEAILQVERLDEWDTILHQPKPTGEEAYAEFFTPVRRPAGAGLAGLVAPRVPDTPLSSERVQAAEGVRLAEEALGRKVMS
jgi:hypothetical protein